MSVETEWIGHSHCECFGEHVHTPQICAICGMDIHFENYNEYAFTNGFGEQFFVCAKCRGEFFKYETFF